MKSWYILVSTALAQCCSCSSSTGMTIFLMLPSASLNCLSLPVIPGLSLAHHSYQWVRILALLCSCLPEVIFPLCPEASWEGQLFVSFTMSCPEEQFLCDKIIFSLCLQTITHRKSDLTGVERSSFIAQLLFQHHIPFTMWMRLISWREVGESLKGEHFSSLYILWTQLFNLLHSSHSFLIL